MISKMPACSRSSFFVSLAFIFFTAVGNVVGLNYDIEGVVQGSFERVLQPLETMDLSLQPRQTLETGVKRKVPAFLA